MSLSLLVPQPVEVGVPNPAYASAIERADDYLVVTVCESSEVDPSNHASAAFLSLSKSTGKLSLLSRIEHSPHRAGVGACHVTLEALPSAVLAAVSNYHEGRTDFYRIDNSTNKVVLLASTPRPEAGSGIVKERQMQPHAHHGVWLPKVHPDRRSILITDLGMDCVFRYTIDCESGVLTLDSFVHCIH